MNIEETKDVVRLGISLGNAVGKSLEDGEITFSDALFFVAPATKIPAAISGINLVDDEILDMDEAEEAELNQMVQDEFNIPQEKSKRVIKAAVTAILKLVKVVQILNE